MKVFESILEYTKVQSICIRHIETNIKVNLDRFREELQSINKNIKKQRNEIIILHKKVVAIKEKLEKATTCMVELKTSIANNNHKNNNTYDIHLLENQIKSLKHEYDEAHNIENVVQIQINTDFKHKLYLENIICDIKTNLITFYDSIINSMIDLKSLDSVNT